MSGSGEERVAAAASRGCLVHLPEANELFVDIDDVQSRARYDAVVQILADRGLVVSAVGTPSPSQKPGREHIRVRLSRPVRDERERVLLQACLGSDAKREACSYLELEAGQESVSCFFELPGWVPPRDTDVSRFFPVPRPFEIPGGPRARPPHPSGMSLADYCAEEDAERARASARTDRELDR